MQQLARQLTSTGEAGALPALRQAICRFPSGEAQLHAPLYHNVGLIGAERFLLKKLVKPLKFQEINIS